MSEIFEEENAIILAAAEKMVALGSAAAQKYVNGKESKIDDENGQKILELLTAYRQKDNLENPQLESILYELRELSEESIFPTISPIVGQPLSYQVVGVLTGTYVDQGFWDASSNLFPGVGTKRGYTWEISVAGTLGGVDIYPGATIRALTDNPGQNLDNWRRIN